MGMDKSTSVGGRRNKGTEAPAGSQCGKGTRTTAVKNLAKRFKKTRTRRG